jgi:hypothetical protein
VQAQAELVGVVRFTRDRAREDEPDVWDFGARANWVTET